MKDLRKCLLQASTATISFFAFCSVAHAQTTPSSDGAQQSQRASGMDDIVVTAERRESSIQDIPISISAFTGETLQNRGVSNVEELSNITPSLEVYAEQVNNEHYTIRGIGDSNEDLTTDSGVAVYLNDVYLAQPGSANAGIYDVARVEVLRGPQGTLYGKNAVGGVVNIITNKPTDFLDGQLLMEVGELGRRMFTAAASDRLLEGVSGRLAGYSLKTDGAYRNLTTGERANGIDTQSLRGSLRIAPEGSPLEVNFIADYTDARQDGVLKSVIVDTPGAPFILKDFLSAPYPTQEDDIRSGRSNNNGEQGVRHWGLTMAADYSAEPGTLSLISGYREERSFNFEDVDRTEQQAIDFFAEQDTWATSHELRFVSDPNGLLSANGRLSFALGLYYFHEQGSRNQFIDLTGRVPGSMPGDPDNPDDGLLGPGTPDSQDSTARFLQTINTNSYAAYGQATYYITDALSFTLGARYTIEKKAIVIDASSVANQPGGDPFSLFVSEGPFNGANSATFKEFTPKAAIEFEPNDDLRFYASYARGFKSGGFNGQAATADDLYPFRPETAENYELGMKADLLDRRLRLNTSIFLVDFTDLQVAGTNEVGQIFTTNAADAQIKGFEMELTAQPFPNFTITAGYAYLDAVYKDYFVEIFDPTVQGGPPFRLISLEGKQLNGVPKHAGSIAADYTIDLANGGEVQLSADGVFRGDTYTSEDTFRSPGYEVFNARIGYTTPNGRWEFAGWLRNLTDAVYYRGGGAIPDFGRDTGRIGLIGDPRTAGVAVKLNLGG